MPNPMTKQETATTATDGVRENTAIDTAPSMTKNMPIRIVVRKPKRR